MSSVSSVSLVVAAAAVAFPVGPEDSHHGATHFFLVIEVFLTSKQP